MAYEVGDHVVVIKPEDAENFPFGWDDDGMDEYIGRVWEVIHKHYNTYHQSWCYRIGPIGGSEPNEWKWCDEFLRPAGFGVVSRPEEYEVDDHVIVVKPVNADSDYAVGWNEYMDRLIGSECIVVAKYDNINGVATGKPLYRIRPTDKDEIDEYAWISEFLFPAYQEPDFDFDPDRFNELLARF